MSLNIFIDIETIPPPPEIKSILKTEVIHRLLRDFSSAKKQNEAVADKQYHLNDRQDNSNAQKDDQPECPENLFRRLSLCAEYGRILCIGVIIEKRDSEIRKGLFGFDNENGAFHLDESKTLRGFGKLLKEEFDPKMDLIIGHNIMDFDLPFIHKRSRIKSIKPSVKFNFARYRSAPIFDTMREWSLWNLRETSISLSLLAELLEIGLKKTEGVDGCHVYDEFLAGNHSLIAEYCLQDVEITRAIYHRIKIS